MATSVRLWRGEATERRSRQVLTVVVVLITLALSYYLGRRPTMRYVQILIGLVALAVLVWRPQLGLAAILLSGSLLHFAIGTGTLTQINMAYLLVPVLSAVWLGAMLVRRSFQLVPSRANAPAIGLVLITTLAFIYGNLPLQAFAQHAPLRSQIGGWGLIVFSAAALLLVGNQVKDIRWLKLLVWLFLPIATVYFVGHGIRGAGRLERLFPIGATDSMFWLWYAALSAGLLLFHPRQNFFVRLYLLLCVGLAIFVSYRPQQISWASGWLPITVVMGMLVLLRWPRLAVVVGMLGTLTIALNFELLRSFALSGDNQYSLLTRTAAAQVVSQIISTNPLLGVGPANYYWYTPLYSLLGYYIRFNSHNQYVDILAQTGLLGLACFLWLVAEIAGIGLRLRRALPPGFERAYACAGVAGVVGMLATGMLGDWVLPFVYNIGVNGFRSSVVGWMFLGGLIAVEGLRRRSAPAAEPAPGPAAPDTRLALPTHPGAARHGG